MSTSRSAVLGPFLVAALWLLPVTWIDTLAAGSVEVTISGLAGEPLQNVQASLSIYRRSGAENLTGELIRELHARAGGEIPRPRARETGSRSMAR